MDSRRLVGQALNDARDRTRKEGGCEPFPENGLIVLACSRSVKDGSEHLRCRLTVQTQLRFIIAAFGETATRTS